MTDSLGGIFLRLGLSLDELKTDFIAAERTTRENLNRLNRESNLIRLRAEVEIGNLDATADATQILTVRENALNEQIKIQNDRIKLATAAWQDLQTKHGESAVVTQRAAAALERERLTLQQLEKELQNVKKAQTEVNQSQSDVKPQTKSNSLLDMYQGLKGNIGGDLGKLTSAFNDLKSASGSADGAITKSLEIIGSIPHPVGKAVAAFASMPLIMQGVENSLIDIAKPAIAAGDAFYVMSRGMQMSIADTARLSMICKVTGIEISEVNSAMRRFSTQLNKTGDSDNAMLKMLKRYGAEVRDTSGRIKNEIDLAGELGKALKRAQAEGNGVAFRDIVGGKFWSGDFVTFLEDFADNVEQAKKVVKNGLSDPVKAHAIQGELNTLEAQAGQLGSAFSSAFMPIAEVLVPRTRERMGELTKIIQDNADGIKTLGLAVASVLDGVESVAATVGGTMIKAVGSVGDLFSKQQNSIIERYANDEDVKTIEDLIQKELQQRYTFTERTAIENNPALYQQTLAYYQPMFQALEEVRKKAEEEGKKVGEAVQEATYESFHQLKGYNFENPDDIRKAFEETQKLSDELYKLTHTDFENKTLDIYRWQEKLLNDEKTTAEQREIIAKISTEKLAQIEKEKNDKIQKENEEFQKRTQDYLKSAADIEYSLTHSAFEKQLYDIEQWKDAQLEKADTAEETAAIIANAAAKEADAFQREMDRIQGRIESAQDRLMRLTSSQKDYDLYKAQKQYQQDLKDLPAEFAKRLYDAEVANILRRASEDRGGSYTRSKGGSTSNPYLIEFDKPKQTDWTKLDAGKLAYESLRQKNQELADSYSKVIGAQEFLTQSIDFTAQNLNRAAYSFEYIEGDKIVNAFNDSTQRMIDAQNELADATKQTSEEMSATDYWYNRIDQITDQIVGSMANGHIQRIDGGYAADSGYGADLHNFSTGLQQLGLSNEQVHSYLDQINQSVQQLRETEIQQNPQQQGNSNITVSPNINIDLGGAYVFDDAKKQELTNDITNNVVSSVKEAVQDATSRANYGFGN